VVVFALLVPGCSLPAGSPPDRIVLVTVDTLRADRLGCYGRRDAHTANIDTVAATGVRFENAISPAPLTLPAHASLMTALDPPEHGVRHNALQRLGGGIPTLAERLRDAGYVTAGFVGALVLDRRFGLDRGFDVYDDAVGDRRSATVGFAERRADRVVDSALAWLESAGGRFFLWVHVYDPHASYSPPAGFASAFASRPYEGEIAFVDAQLGRLFGELRRRWPDGETLIVITSDHGESLGEHRESRHSYSIYDATQRVPLVMSGAGLPRGISVAAPVGLVDVAPTLLALARAEPLADVAGRDLRPLIDGDRAGERAVYVETLATHLDYGWSPLLGLRTAGFKYIRAPRPELYDLRADPAELRNVAARQPETAQRLDRLLSERLAAAEPRGDGRLVADLDEEERDRLRSLGYVVPVRGPAASPIRAAVGGPDPKDEIDTLSVLDEVQRHIDAGRLEQALARLDRIEGAGTAVPALRASVALATRDFARAERDARAVLAQQPGRADVLIILGRALAGQARFADARASFEAAAHLDPRSAVAWTLLGRAHQDLREPEAADRAYERAIQANSRALEPRWRLAALRLGRGQLAEADAVLAGLERPLGPAAAAELAVAEARAGRAAAAVQRLRAARARYPDDVRLKRALAVIEPVTGSTAGGPVGGGRPGPPDPPPRSTGRSSQPGPGP
jgi:arylsulfatase A-like enzyme/Flp pilus assembly protein TadD